MFDAVREWWVGCRAGSGGVTGVWWRTADLQLCHHLPAPLQQTTAPRGIPPDPPPPPQTGQPIVRPETLFSPSPSKPQDQASPQSFRQFLLILHLPDTTIASSTTITTSNFRCQRQSYFSHRSHPILLGRFKYQLVHHGI